jgi:hypothetical protein
MIAPGKTVFSKGVAEPSTPRPVTRFNNHRGHRDHLSELANTKAEQRQHTDILTLPLIGCANITAKGSTS